MWSSRREVRRTRWTITRHPSAAAVAAARACSKYRPTIASYILSTHDRDFPLFPCINRARSTSPPTQVTSVYMHGDSEKGDSVQECVRVLFGVGDQDVINLGVEVTRLLNLPMVSHRKYTPELPALTFSHSSRIDLPAMCASSGLSLISTLMMWIGRLNSPPRESMSAVRYAHTSNLAAAHLRRPRRSSALRR